MNTIVIFMLKLIKQDLFFHRHDFRRISNKYSRYLFYFKQSHDVQSVTNRILYFVPQKKKKKKASTLNLPLLLKIVIIFIMMSPFVSIWKAVSKSTMKTYSIFCAD